MLVYLKKIYDLLPKEHLKILRYLPDRLLFGKSYIEWKSKISFDKDLIDQNLYDTLCYVREHTRFGKDHIPKSFDLKEVRTLLESLPLISSYDLATNLSYYTSDEYNSLNSYTATTGGTGGSPTTLLFSNELFGIEWAHVHHIWSYAGYNCKRDTKLTLRGKVLKSDKLVEYSPVYNELIVDVFKVNNDNFDQFLEAIKPYDIKYIHGYPSLVKEYMTYFESHHSVPKLNAILLTSEGASIEDKKDIADFFGCPVLSFYGQSERALIAIDIESNGIYKVYTSYGYPRIVEGELVITSFVNRALPLVNYKIGDGAEIVEDEHCLYLTNLSSRRGKDFVYLTKEKKIPSTALGLHASIQNEILYYQIHQKEFGKVEIRIFPKVTSHISPEEILSIFGAHMKERLQDFEVTLRIVQEHEIIRSHRSKMILLVQELNV
jgi:phenylacetate-CoA ligase